jgi:hypothetical protein
MRVALGVSSWIALGALFLHSACSSDGRPPAPGELNGASGSAGNAGAGSGESGFGGSGGAAGSAGTSSSSDDNGGSSFGGSGMGGSTPLRDDCTPSEACTSYCSLLGPDPSCGVGNATQCSCLCEDRFNDPCPQELAAVLACASSHSATGDCRTAGRVVPGCEAESVALELCDLGGREQLCARGTPLCDTYCRATTLAYCVQSSESVGECLCGCENSIAGRCDAELEAFMTCTSEAPTFTCGESGELIPGACATEWQALDGCKRGLSPDAG